MPPDVAALRIPDVQTFLAVSRFGSVTAAARDLRVTPSQVSKAIARLERSVGASLLVRKARRVAISADGSALLPKLESLLAAAHAVSTSSAHDRERRLTVAAPSYLASVFLPTFASAAPEARVRALEVSPAFMRAYATENVFELGITVGAEKMPGSWTSTRVGPLRRALLASPSVARSLGSRPSPARIAELEFVMPVYNSGGEFLPGDDACPLARRDRKAGHESSTIGVALALAAESGQLVFGPAIAARPYIASGRLVEVRVPGWRLTEDLYLHANDDRVMARTQRAILAAARRAIAGG